VNLLYLAHRLPYPPNKGEKIRSFHQIRHLARRHTIHLCSFVDDRDDKRYGTDLRESCASVALVYRSPVRSLLSVGEALVRDAPFSVALYKNREFADNVRQLARKEQFDCLIASSSSVAQYASLLPKIPKIIGFIDIDSEKWRLYALFRKPPLSLVYGREERLLSKYEMAMARFFDHSVVVSQDERRALESRVSDRPVSVISNGVDIEYFAPGAATKNQARLPIIVFTGVMDYYPNVDAVEYFCKDILSLVCAAVPATQFHIVGRNPTRRVKRISNRNQVVVTGTVPDVRPYLRKAAVAVAPFRLARGVQNKVLEALAMGLPVVGSRATIEAIGAADRDAIRIADDPASFARHVIAYLQADSESCRNVARQARSYVESDHRWEDQGARLENLLDQVVGTNSRTHILEVKRVALA
jgi:sugar transferase (PEP-CTERM/EpsH1 system associated)